jgi:type III secretion protein U
VSEKTEKPTPKRLRDAREKGQVAKSKEIATCAVVVGLFAYFWFFFDTYLERLKYMALIPAQNYLLPFDQALINCAKTGFREFALLILPLAVVAGMIALLSYLMQIGLLAAFEPIKPDIKKINPVEGVKRIFSLSNLVELGKSILKIVLLGFIIYVLIKGNVKNLIHIPRGTPQTALDVLAAILKKLAVAVSALFIAVAIVDYFFQKHLHLRKLKMSKEDIKREYKDREGDPLLKQRRRQLQLEMAMDDMAARIKQSTVVLVQAGKRAVALYYERGKTPLPILSAKGGNLAAERIMAMARKHGITVLPDAELTRRLYADCEQGNYIPPRYIDPVAVILRKVMGLEGEDSG